ncbi:GntR family transcriptional regulator [Bacillus sp. B15-48]|uniref:GntR family transcriptional regulator n=1 Tax=Bacillus sp. B15-48 TaxID=1548601 RepID=UPI00193F5898|nr:GntR family transcriptional regulator [Bacillus sp. B15-48]
MTSKMKKSSIDRNSSVPIYKQIKEILIEELSSGDGDPNRPFSTEQELTRRFHVSRAPVRQALKELTNEGYVYRERAKGTFPVQKLPVRPPGLEVGGLVRFLREQGIECQSNILGVDRVFPTEELGETLHIKPSEEVLRVSRIILLEEKPLIWTQTYLCVSEDFEPSVQEVGETDSVFELLESELGIFISRGDHQIFASGANCEEAHVLDINEGEPILIMETKLYTRNDQLIGWRKAVHKADEYKLSFTVNR